MEYHQELVSHIDRVITNHGAQNPELLTQLLELRAQAVALRLQPGKQREYLGVVVKVAALAKYVSDVWDNIKSP
jgi:hypothetical protein